jgi:hypothetical protein
VYVRNTVRIESRYNGAWNRECPSQLFLSAGKPRHYRFLRKVSGLALIFCQGQTKPVKSSIIFRNDRLKVYLLSHYILRH